MSFRLTEAELAELDQAVVRALETDREDHLEVLGYGEISCVVAWPAEAGRLACKRLPPFGAEHDAERYTACVTEYLERLAEAGVHPQPTEVQVLRRGLGELIVYCVQPVSDADSLGPRYLATCDQDRSVEVFDAILDLVEGCVGPSLGLDGQLSNWVVTDDGLSYLDISTPMMRDDNGRERLDTDLFLASIPWALRGLVRRVFLGQILDKYYQPRGVAVDLLGNLIKEGLGHLIEPLTARANLRVSPAITADELRAYYRSDAQMWALLQRLRRLDRAWQRRVRRRTYQFLLPGQIERRL